MVTRVFEDLTKSAHDPLWLAVHDLTINEIVYAVHGSSPEVVSRIEGVLSSGAKSLFHQSRARPRDFGDEATVLAQAKFIRHINFYESGVIGRPLGKLLCRFYPLKYSSQLRQFWLLKDRLDTGVDRIRGVFSR